jgi:hypothetical protein
VAVGAEEQGNAPERDLPSAQRFSSRSDGIEYIAPCISFWPDNQYIVRACSINLKTK